MIFCCAGQMRIHTFIAMSRAEQRAGVDHVGAIAEAADVDEPSDEHGEQREADARHLRCSWRLLLASGS